MKNTKDENYALPYLCFQKHEEYMQRKNFTACVPAWWRMYEGKQFNPDELVDIPKSLNNICAWVIDSQHATILGTTTSLNFRCFDKNVSTLELKKFDEYQQKEIKMNVIQDKVVMDSLVGASGIAYYYWNEQKNSIKANKEGCLCVDTIDILDFFCSNPREQDIQKQKYIGWRQREEVKAVREMVSEDMPNREEVIKSIVPDDFDPKDFKDEADVEAGLVTIYTMMFRIDGEVYWSRSTKTVKITNEPIALNPDVVKKKLEKIDENDELNYAPDNEQEYKIDPQMSSTQDATLENESEEEHNKKNDKMSLYPVAVLSLKPRRNCLYGISQIEGLENNQKIINFLISMVAKEVQDTAWSTVIMKEDAAGGQQWTGEPGGSFIDYTPGPNFGIKRLEGNALNNGVMEYVGSIFDITKTLTGTNELVSDISNAKDVTAYALRIIEEQKNQKIEILQKRYWSWLIDNAKIRLQFYKHYFPESYYMYELSDPEFKEEQMSYNKLQEMANADNDANLKYQLEKKGQPSKIIRKKLDPRKYLGRSFDIVCEVGKGSKYSEIIDMDLINTLFLNGAYEKMSPESLEMWLNLNSFMSESKKADIRVLIEQQKQSELAKYKQMLNEMQEVAKVLLTKNKQLQTQLKLNNEATANLEKEFGSRLESANRIVKYKDEEMRNMQNKEAKLPSAKEMAENG